MLGLLALAAIVVEIEPLIGVSPNALDEIRVSLARACERRGLALRSWNGPVEPGDDVLHLRVIGGRSRLDVTARRIDARATATSTKVQGPIEGDWDARMSEVFDRLFPVAPVSVVASPQTGNTLGSILFVGGSLVAAGLAVGFAILASDANNELTNRLTFNDEHDSLVQSRTAGRFASLGFAATSILCLGIAIGL